MVILGKPAIFRIRNATTIPATEERVITDSDIERETLDFGPFNAGQIANLSTESVLVKLDGDTNRSYPLQSGERLSIDVLENIQFQRFVVENLDAANDIAINEIDVTYTRSV